jgi:hypothetical protein
MNIWMKRTLGVLAGAAAGFAYYYFIGCVGGSCPISSNPYISTLYGGLFGGLAGWSRRNTPQSSPHRSP